MKIESFKSFFRCIFSLRKTAIDDLTACDIFFILQRKIMYLLNVIGKYELMERERIWNYMGT